MKNILALIGPVETKVAAGGGTGALVSLLFGLAAFYHWFTPPPAYLTALAVTVLSTLIAWVAPHTPRAVSPLTLTPDEMQAVRTVLANVPGWAKVSTSTGAGSAVVVQPSATAKPTP